MQAGFSYFDKNTPILAIRSLFYQYDTNKTGKLEEDEMKNFLERDMGLRPDQSIIYELLVDKDGDHAVSFEEFLGWMRSGERFENINDSSRFQILCNAVEYFKKYDFNDNDTLDKQEFRILMKSLGHEEGESEDVFNKIDQFRNGKISFWEFMMWLNWVPINI